MRALIFTITRSHSSHCFKYLYLTFQPLWYHLPSIGFEDRSFVSFTIQVIFDGQAIMRGLSSMGTMQAAAVPVSPYTPYHANPRVSQKKWNNRLVRAGKITEIPIHQLTTNLGLRNVNEILNNVSLLCIVQRMCKAR
jgi:hypothetical protein